MASSPVRSWNVSLDAQNRHRRIANEPADDSAVSALVAEMARRWRQGERPRAEEFLSQCPELVEQPEAAIDLIYEEICLRQDAGEKVDPAELLKRFPRWAAQLEVLLHCDQLLTTETATPRFPAAGETLGDFRLLAELGRGLQGRVFVATQSSVANRPVVLKLTARAGREHLSLGRLQHTHIVPLYGVQDDPARHLRLLCMPYFGGTTLGRILEAVPDRSAEPGTGGVIIQTLEQAERAAPVIWPDQSRGRAFLGQLSFIQAVCWMGACLADALAYAHDRGLVHLDLKPSNVLLAGDGQPMLLDFHLAREPLAAGKPLPELFGGSPPYMSPEQRTALAAVSMGQDIPAPVDGRSDLYSLGMVLYEALGGIVPGGREKSLSGLAFEPVEPVRPLRQCNPQISVALADVIEKCLAPRPGARYATAAAVASDLRRHLDDLPLRGVPNRSWRERWGKWRRRRPHALVLGSMALIVLTALAASGMVAWSHVRWQLDEARAAMAQGQEHLRLGRFREAASNFQRGLDLAVNLPGNHDLASEFRTHLQLARKAEAEAELTRFARDLHGQADHVRFHASGDNAPPAHLDRLEHICATWWEQRGRINEFLHFSADSELTGQLKRDCLDLVLLWADLRMGHDSVTAAERRDVLQVLNDAEGLVGSSPLLEWERQRHKGGKAPASDGRSASPRNPWEHYILGRTLFRSGRIEEALPQLNRAVALQPNGLWPNFYLGLCAYRLGRWDDAVVAFTVCVSLAPESAICRYNRGLAFRSLGRPERALEDYDRALQLEPRLASALLNRGILHLEACRYPEAAADFQQALHAGANPSAAHYNLALVHWNQGDRSQARVHAQRALEHQPEHQEARALAERLRREN
jgi:serine/threonine protein kinase/Flp pilus assembly protein TadD